MNTFEMINETIASPQSLFEQIVNYYLMQYDIEFTLQRFYLATRYHRRNATVGLGSFLRTISHVMSVNNYCLST